MPCPKIACVIHCEFAPPSAWSCSTGYAATLRFTQTVSNETTLHSPKPVSVVSCSTIGAGALGRRRRMLDCTLAKLSGLALDLAFATPDRGRGIRRREVGLQ